MRDLQAVQARSVPPGKFPGGMQQSRPSAPRETGERENPRVVSMVHAEVQVRQVQNRERRRLPGIPPRVVAGERVAGDL